MPPSLPAQTDVAIVGAGMAGLAAARLLTARNRQVVILEARNRIGGRAWTDTERLGLPVDLGAAKLHSADINPLVVELRRRAAAMQADDGDFWLFDRGNGKGREASALDYEALARLYDRIDAALIDAKILHKDIALPRQVTLDAPGAGARWIDTARALAGPLNVGVAFDQVSAFDAPRLSGTGNDVWLPGGLGAWLNSYAENLPVFLSHPVSRIDWGGDFVTLATAAGELRAAACIVTVPVGVLAGEGMVFQPALPAAQRAALRRLSMGQIERIALRYQPGSFEAPANTQAILRVGTDADDRHAVLFHLNAQAQPLAVATIGGATAARFAGQGEAAMVDMARARLKTMLGGDIDRRFIGGIASGWSADPFSRGAVSVAPPGQAAARSAAGRAPRQQLFFAGEAFAPANWTGSIAGAWLSGREVAAQVLRVLG
ncbi:MAG TPA: NAD(P)/FAD-dependent oxidoreductase [Alphaproteobacteria bacterium]